MVMDRPYVSIVDLKVLAELGDQLDLVVVQREAELALRALMRDTSSMEHVEVARKLAQANMELAGVENVWEAIDLLRGEDAKSFEVIQDG
jgi:hypothetical protein